MAKTKIPTTEDLVNHPNIINLDCLDFLANYEGRKFDLVYLDPPYFLDRTFSLEAASERVSFKGDWEDQEIEEFCHQIGGTSGSRRIAVSTC